MPASASSLDLPLAVRYNSPKQYHAGYEKDSTQAMWTPENDGLRLEAVWSRLVGTPPWSP